MQLRFAFLLSINIFAALARKRPRIRQGHTAQNMAKMPWMVYIQPLTRRTGSICSGSILDKWHVLTAAHCLCPGKMVKITIVTGTLDINAGYKNSYTVSSYSLHPKVPRNYCFRGDSEHSYDVAVLKTTSAIQFSSSVRSIEVDFDRIQDGVAVIKMGYGLDERNHYGALKYAFAQAKKCFQSLICTEREEGYSFHGDSGAPLVACEEKFQGCKQIAVMSGEEKGKELFSSTHFLESFIKRALQDKDFTPVTGTAVPTSAVGRVFVLGFLCFTLIFTSL